MTTTPAFPTEVEISDNACDYAEKQLLELVQALSTDRAAYHFNESFPHEYVKSVMHKLNEIRGDIRSREGTPGFGKLREPAK